MYVSSCESLRCVHSVLIKKHSIVTIGYYLFVLDDSLTSERFTTRNEKLTTTEDEGDVRAL